MTQSVKLSGTLPANNDLNGLEDHATGFLSTPEEYRVVIGVINAKEIRTDTDTGEATAVIRFLRIEVIDDKDAKERLQNLANRAHEHRTGKAVLPLDTEDEIRELFGSLATSLGSSLHDGETITFGVSDSDDGESGDDDQPPFPDPIGDGE